jgi:GNAT superfamily N-acetyltransferase
LHQRSESVAAAAGVAGRFRAWQQNGLFAVAVTDPGLRFLCTVTGVTADTVASVAVVLRSSWWGGVRPTVIASAESASALSAAGLVVTGERPLAVRRLADPPAVADGVADADDGFLDLLLAGYDVTGAVADYVRAEHAMPAVRRFVAVEDGTPIAAAAMTVHDDVAVLGGAATLPAHRGRGAQTRLLAHRLRLAADAGCTLAVATARAGSVSSANLSRAGFTVHPRLAWTAGPTAG